MNFAAFGEMIEGSMIADAVASLGSINIIAGELDADFESLIKERSYCEERRQSARFATWQSKCSRNENGRGIQKRNDRRVRDDSEALSGSPRRFIARALAGSPRVRLDLQDVMVCVAKLVGISPAQVMEVPSLHDVSKAKAREHHLQVCQTISCLLAGSEEIKKTVERVLNLKNGQTTADGQFSYQLVECLASCHTAPCMQVNDDYHENLTPESTEKLIAE